MKGLLIFPIIRNLGKADGIVIKNEGIKNGFIHNGADIDTIEYFADGMRLNGELFYDFSKNKYQRIFQYHYKARNAIRRFVKDRHYDFIWYRTPIMNRRIADFIEGLHKEHPGVQIIIEYGYYPYVNELTRIGKVRYKMNRGHELRAHRNAAFVVTYAGQQQVDNLTVLPINNGVDLSDLPVAHPRSDVQQMVKFVSVSSLKKWHAYERLVAGLPAYLAQPGHTPVHFNIVGFGPEYDKIVNMTRELGVESSVTFHHFKTGQELDDIYNDNHVAIGTLGFHRIGITFSSSLKNREYFGRGLPIVLSTPDEDMPADLPYVLYVPEGEEPLDIAPLVSFAQNLYRNTSVNDDIRQYAEETVTWNSKIKTVMEYLSRK
ncbi:MAG: hypothetical protein EOO08_07015 [Chitinophagaceae bacterium]|nr:MAG: hypothetical protein EOO08_07015 [Chitinophagaceae bacterium]